MYCTRIYGYSINKAYALYKLIALVMLLIGGLQAYTVVWDLGDVGIGLMTIFNMIALYPLSGEAMDALNDYEKRKKLQ